MTRRSKRDIERVQLPCPYDRTANTPSPPRACSVLFAESAPFPYRLLFLNGPQVSHARLEGPRQWAVVIPHHEGVRRQALLRRHPRPIELNVHESGVSEVICRTYIFQVCEIRQL